MLFHRSEMVPDAADVFIRMAHAPPDRRSENKQLANQLAERKDLQLIPSPVECRLYDDKITQAELLSSHLPPTFVSHTKNEATQALRNLNLPFVSKSQTGASSVNVRLIDSWSAALKEIDSVFQSDGIPIFNGQFQKGYLIWQEYIETLIDWRVILLARRFGMVIHRRNWFQSLPRYFPRSFFWGESGTREIYTNEDRLTDTCIELLEFLLSIAEKHDLRFQMADVLRDPRGNLRLLETGSGFGLSPAHEDFVFFEKVGNVWERCNYRQRDFFEIVAKCIADRSFWSH